MRSQGMLPLPCPPDRCITSSQAVRGAADGALTRSSPDAKLSCSGSSRRARRSGRRWCVAGDDMGGHPGTDKQRRHV